MQVAVSERSRRLQFSTKMRSPLQSYITFVCTSGAAAMLAEKKLSTAIARRTPGLIFIFLLLQNSA
jgi:hypothetical protein